MQTEDLPPGQLAADEHDRIILSKLPSGRFRFDGVAWTEGGVAFNFANPDTYESLEKARDAGILWAQERGVSYLYVQYPDA